MKKKSLKLSINEPCHEDWGKMSPNEKGRFCDSCAKPVIDFSTSTDIEIIQFLDAHKGQKTCGRFKVTQLERPMNRPVADKVYSGFSLRTALLGVTLSSLLGLESCKSDEPVMMGDVAYVPEQPVKCVKTPVEEIKQGEVSVQEYDHTNERLMSGYITDHSGNKVVKAKLILFDAQGNELAKTLTNTDGSFRLELNWEKKPSYVKIVASDFENQIIHLKTTEQLQEMKILMRETPMMKGDVMIKED